MGFKGGRHPDGWPSEGTNLRDLKLLGRAAAVSLAGLAGTPAAAQPGGPVREIAEPEWRAVPSAQQASALYPYPAMAHEKIGSAVVRCSAKADGSLDACEVVCEDPAGWKFGDAALKLMRYYKLRSQQSDGRSVEGATVTMPAYFFPSFLARPQRCDKPAT